jgi:two-component system, cell cycle sensor histidine kinase and response regulator CckA
MREPHESPGQTASDAELRESQQRFAVLFERAPALTVFARLPEGAIVEVNRAFEQITGYSRDEVRGKTGDVLGIVDQVVRQRMFAEMREHGLVRNFEVEICTKAGDRRVALVNVDLVELGGHAYSLVTALDVTQLRRSEAALRERDARFRAMFETEPECVKLLSADGALQEMNRAGLDMIEADTFDQVASQCVYPLVAESDREEFRELTRRVFAGESGRLSFRINGLKGATRWLETHAVPLRNASGAITSLLSVTRDLTEQKQMEEQLRQSQKMDAFGQLAGGVAHDFNNLLTVINGYSEILLSMLPPQGPTREATEAISEAGARAASLTRQMLAFSRRTVVNPTLLNVNTVIDASANMLRRMIGESVQITTALDPAVAPVRLDPDQMAQVLMNLAINARDAMPQGGRLTIETRNVTLDDRYAATHLEAEPGERVLVAVHDTGNGMPPDVMARIFEPFFTTKDVGKGTGLGLAVVHGIIKQSGGNIEVLSEVGVGTSFMLYFPAVKNAQPAPITDAADRAERGTEVILFVEDDDRVRALGTLALESRGYTVLAAANGREAVRLADTHGQQVALLISDVVMPGMNGRELAETLQSRFPRLKVLFVSGHTDDAVVRHGVLHAEVEFVQKPYSPSFLARRVRELLNAQSAR